MMPITGEDAFSERGQQYDKINYFFIIGNERIAFEVREGCTFNKGYLHMNETGTSRNIDELLSHFRELAPPL